MDQRIGIKISGLAGLYCYFMLLCDRWMAKRRPTSTGLVRQII
jgi:hypothetical protein